MEILIRLRVALFLSLFFGLGAFSFVGLAEAGVLKRCKVVATKTKASVEFLLEKPEIYDVPVGSSSERFLDSLSYYRELPSNFGKQAFSLGRGIGHVRALMKKNPMKHGLLLSDHPWVTGINPSTGLPVWSDNVIYATPNNVQGVTDKKMLGAIGKFMTGMVKRSVGEVEIPLGPRRRMPHTINYIHGTSHYNSGILIFNTLREGFEHFSDPAFRAELKRFEEVEKREILLFFRDRDYGLHEYAMFVVYVRMRLPWFLNSDGPKKTVLWGNPAPFPVVNVLTGHWATDLFLLRDAGDTKSIVRDTVGGKGYFEAQAYAEQPQIINSHWPERLLAIYSYHKIRARGAKGNHSTLDRRLVDKPGSDNHRISHILPARIDEDE